MVLQFLRTGELHLVVAAAVSCKHSVATFASLERSQSIDSISKHQECVLQVKSRKNSLAGTSLFFFFFRCFALNSEIRASSQV